VSVKLNTMRLLGSDLTAEKIIWVINQAVLEIDQDAEDMGIDVDWSTIKMELGAEYEEELSFVKHNIRHPYLRASVQAEKRTQ
jgi:hypothetical protein